MMITKMHGVLGLFVLLVLILMVKPNFYDNMYKNVLGRVVLIAFLLFFAMNNLTLGLLVALIIIIGTNVSFVEGMDNMDSDNTDGAMASTAMAKMGSEGSPVSVGDDGEPASKKRAPIQVTTGTNGTSTTTTPNTTKSSTDGVDRSAMQETMKPVSSNSVPIQPDIFKGGDVEASGANDLASGSKRQLEGFMMRSRKTIN
jgi:hypothetical protein